VLVDVVVSVVVRWVDVLVDVLVSVIVVVVVVVDISKVVLVGPTHAQVLVIARRLSIAWLSCCADIPVHDEPGGQLERALQKSGRQVVPKQACAGSGPLLVIHAGVCVTAMTALPHGVSQKDKDDDTKTARGSAAQVEFATFNALLHSALSQTRV